MAFVDRDQVAGFVLVALGVAYHRAAESFPRSLLSDRVGAAGFPKLLAAALVTLAAVLILSSLVRNMRAGRREKATAGTARRFLQAGGMLAFGAGYLLVVSWTGYMLGIALLVLGVLLYQREPPSWKVAVTAAACGFLFWAFFVFALNIPMPPGIWAQFLAGR